MLLENGRTLACGEFAQRAEYCDKSDDSSWNNINAVNSLGLNAMFIREEYCGAHISYTASMESVRENSNTSASTGMILATNFHAIKPVVDFGTEEHKTQLLPHIAQDGLVSLAIAEPDAGLDVAGMRTRFAQHGDDIVINGGKAFIINGDVVDLYVSFGNWSEIDDTKTAVSVVVLEKDAHGFSVIRKEDKIGRRALSKATISFDHRRVPRATGQSFVDASRRSENPVCVAEQVADPRGGARAGYCPDRIRRRCPVYQRAQAIRAEDHRVPGNSVHVSRHGDRPRDAHHHGRGATVRGLWLLQRLSG